MEIEREIFFTEEEEEEEDQKKKFPSLTFLAARLVYYINVNFMYNLRKIQVNPFSCLCYQYSGCPLSNGVKDYCNICSLFTKHNVEDNEKNFSIRHLIKKNIELVKDLKEYYIDIDNCDYDFKLNGKSISFHNIVFSKTSSIKPALFFWCIFSVSNFLFVLKNILFYIKYFICFNIFI